MVTCNVYVWLSHIAVYLKLLLIDYTPIQNKKFFFQVIERKYLPITIIKGANIFLQIKETGSSRPTLARV